MFHIAWFQCLYLIWIPYGWPKPARRIWQASENTAAASTNDDATTMAEDPLLLLAFFWGLLWQEGFRSPGKHATLKVLKACKDNSKLSDREGKTWQDQYTSELNMHRRYQEITSSITPAFERSYVASAMTGLLQFWAPKDGYFVDLHCIFTMLLRQYVVPFLSWQANLKWTCSLRLQVRTLNCIDDHVQGYLQCNDKGTRYQQTWSEHITTGKTWSLKTALNKIRSNIIF